MPKRKRTPPPPKPVEIKIPESLKTLAIQCRQLREQAQQYARSNSGSHNGAIADQALDRAADEQLNTQLNATIASPAQMSAQLASANSARKGRLPKASNKSKAHASEEEVRQSIIRDAEQQLGIFNAQEVSRQQADAPDVTQTSYLSQPNFYDQSASVQAIRFDPYIAPAQQPFYFTESQTPADTQPAHTNETIATDSPELNQNWSYSPPTPVTNQQSPAYPYMSIPSYPSIPQPQQQQHHQQQQSQAFSLPQLVTPNYYRLPSSYWPQPSSLEASSMLETDHRTLSMKRKPQNTLQPQPQQPHTLQPLPIPGPANTGLMFDNSMYPDPGTFEMTTTQDANSHANNQFLVNGGVFRNLTKDRFGRYSMGGKLVGANNEIYG